MARSRRTENLLATLSLAAGAMAAATGADAAVVATTGLHVFIGNTGPSSSSSNHYLAVGTISHAISFRAFANSSSHSGATIVYAIKASVRSSSDLIVPQAAGTKWSSAGGTLDTPGSEPNVVQSFGSLRAAGAESTKLYFDFRVANASLSKTFYGWFAGSVTGSTFSNIGFTLASYAYDNTGAELGAGVTSSNPVPEPPSIGLLGLAAMATGAAGTRRFKRARAA